MPVLTDIFTAQGEVPDLTAVQVSTRDIVVMAAMCGVLSDHESRWIPVGVPA